MTLNEHVYCMAFAFKMTERVEQWICIKFYVKLEHSSVEMIWMTQKVAAMGIGDCQLHHNNVPAHASCLMQSFLAKHQITQVTHPLYSSDLTPCGFWLFPKLKSPLKGKRFQIIYEIHENMTEQLMVIGELCEVPRCLLRRGLRHHCPVYNVSCIFFSNYLYFS